MITWLIIAALSIPAIFMAIGFQALRHFHETNSRPWDDRGQPTYDTEGKLTGWLE